MGKLLDAYRQYKVETTLEERQKKFAAIVKKSMGGISASDFVLTYGEIYKNVVEAKSYLYNPHYVDGDTYALVA